MVRADNTLVFDIVVGRNDLSNLAGTGLSNVNKVLGQLTDIGRLKAMGVGLGDIEKNTIGLAKQMGITNKTINKTMTDGTRNASKFDARLLGLLFSGMALSRAFGGILRGITNTFAKAEDNTSGLGQATTRLTAAWEFLKFSIFDALNTPFFINLIDGIIGVIRFFSQLSTTTKLVILGVVAGLVAIGTELAIIGQVSLGWKAIFGTSGLLKEVGIIVGSSGIGAITFAIIGLLIVIAVVITAFKEFPEEAKSISASIKTGLGVQVGSLKTSFDRLVKSLNLAENSLEFFGKVGLVIMFALGQAAIAGVGAVILLIDAIVLLIDVVKFAVIGFIDLGRVAQAVTTILQPGGVQRFNTAINNLVLNGKSGLSELRGSFNALTTNLVRTEEVMGSLTATTQEAFRTIERDSALRQLANNEEVIAAVSPAVLDSISSETIVRRTNIDALISENDEKERSIRLNREIIEGVQRELEEEIRSSFPTIASSVTAPI